MRVEVAELSTSLGSTEKWVAANCTVLPGRAPRELTSPDPAAGGPDTVWRARQVRIRLPCARMPVLGVWSSYGSAFKSRTSFHGRDNRGAHVCAIIGLSRVSILAIGVSF